MERCTTDTVPEFSAGDHHRVACFLLDPANPGPADPPLEAATTTPEIAVDTSLRRLELDGMHMHFPIRKGFLQRTVGHVRAVDGVDLVIHKGETVALVGESGCGKTTVGKCAIRLYHPTGGRLTFDNTDITRLGGLRIKPFRRKIQMIFQDPFSSLNPRMLIGDTLIQGMSTHSIGASASDRRERAQTLLQRVGLSPDVVDRYPHEFSGGQRQRIGIARALAVEPELIICDEATSSLDVSVQAQIINLLKELQAELGLSYLFITHDLSVVRYLADRVTVMYLGRIVEQGTNEELFGSPKHPYTRALLSAVPDVDAQSGRKKIVLRGDVPSNVKPPQGCHFHPRCPDAMPACREAYPPPVHFGDTHMCRCILYGHHPDDTTGG
jgi:peptide/nickel transport system ATP-binding protein